MRTLTAEEIQSALAAMSEKIGLLVSNGFSMLKAHYRAPGMGIGATGLAGAIGKDSYGTGNIQYGKFCHQVADILEYVPEVVVKGDTRWTYTLCNASPVRDRKGGFMWLLKPETALALAMERLGIVRPLSNLTVFEDLENAKQSIQAIAEKSRSAVIQARIGQGVSRNWVMRFWGYACAVTGLAIPELLVASHIKPWRDCTPDEAIAMPNGLLLSPNLDKAFDRGYISFTDEGQIIISKEISAAAISALCIHPETRLRETQQPEHCVFMAYHRQAIFLG